MSFWDDRTPCWALVKCPDDNRKRCGAYLAQHFPCWDLPLEKRCPIADRIGACEECPVYIEYYDDYQFDEKSKLEKDLPRVLVVDDEMLIRWSLYQSLRRSGFEVVLAVDAEEAIEKVKGSFYNFLLIDMKLPGRDGFSLAEEIQHLSPQSRLILMTAYGSEETEKRAHDLGMKYIPKPLDLDKISELFC